MMRMFALPYAGGSATVYNDWKNIFNDELKLCALDYAGRGRRFCEPYFKNIQEAAEDISNRIIREQNDDYVIYGHSMGCIVALETVFLLKKKYAAMPRALIVAATRPPHLMYKDKALEKLTKDELMQEIFSLGQMEKEIMEDKEMYDIVANIIYADFHMFRSYKRDYKDEVLNIPILTLLGKSDVETPIEDMKEWQYYTTGNFKIMEFDGDHFFAFHNEAFASYILDYIKQL